jgi:adenylate cyclase
MLVVCSAIGLLTAIVAATPLGAYLDRVGIDLLQPLRMVLHPPSLDPMRSPVAIVAIDEESYAALGNFPKVVWTPWLAAVIEALLAAKVKVIGLDIVFPTTLDTFVWEGKRPLEGIDIPFLQALNDAAADDRILLGYTSTYVSSIEPDPSQQAAAEGGNLAPLILELDADGVARSYPASFPPPTAGSRTSLAFALAARRDHGAGSRPSRRFTHGRPYPVYSLADLLACANAHKDGFFAQHFAGKSVILAELLDQRTATSPAPALMSVGAPGCRRPAALHSSAQGPGPSASPGAGRSGVYVHATALQNMALGTAIVPLPRLPSALGVGLIALPRRWATPSRPHRRGAAPRHSPHGAAL